LMSGGKEERMTTISRGSILVRSLGKTRIIRWAVIVILAGAAVSDVSDTMIRKRSGFFHPLRLFQCEIDSVINHREIINDKTKETFHKTPYPLYYRGVEGLYESVKNNHHDHGRSHTSASCMC
jgi:hypothetical protein